MTYTDPKAEVVMVQRVGDVTRVGLRLNRTVHEPIAPASLFDGNDMEDVAFDLHRLVESSDVLTFETYVPQRRSLSVGDKLSFRSWWTPDAVELVADASRSWERRVYPNNGDHQHCPLTWKTIAAYGPYEREGYCSGRDWISVEAYDRYIRDDVLRMRRGSSS